MLNITLKLEKIISNSAMVIVKANGLNIVPEILLDIPKDRSNGEFYTNVAMQICKCRDGLNPVKLANSIAEEINKRLKKNRLNSYVEKLEVKGPGFINFYFTIDYLQSVIVDILRNKDRFGSCDIGKGKKILIEFVSANPTGPLSVAHGRQAAVGDVLANILQLCGYKITREYYLNDEGNQINLLAKSIKTRYCELYNMPSALPEGGYKGRYIYDIAKELNKKFGDSLLENEDKSKDIFMSFGIKYIMDMIVKDLSDFGVNFDNYYSQAEMSKSGKIEKSLKILDKKGLIYEKDGALWFKSTKYGDDKDRVLRKSDGSYTYITPDIAYHEDKYRRGYDQLIDMWGPDHHGYIPRIKAASLANGRDKDFLTILIIQLATISRGGKVLAMSTREGEFITLREVIDEVGKDVARFFFLTRRCDSHLDFDLELAKRQSNDNPVYYIQYAHARICGILNNIDDSVKKLKVNGADIRLLKNKEEIDILRALREFPSIIEWAGKSLEPHRLILYLMDLAAVFHVFYSKHRVICDDLKHMNARLVLIKALKSIFSRSLALLGVSYPEKM